MLFYLMCTVFIKFFFFLIPIAKMVKCLLFYLPLRAVQCK